MAHVGTQNYREHFQMSEGEVYYCILLLVTNITFSVSVKTIYQNETICNVIEFQYLDK